MLAHTTKNRKICLKPKSQLPRIFPRRIGLTKVFFGDFLKLFMCFEVKTPDQNFKRFKNSL